MTPLDPRSDRATRALTRSQTAKSQTDRHTSRQTAISKSKKSSGRAKKQHAESTSTKAKQKSKPPQAPKSGATDAREGAIGPEPSSSTPNNATCLTINDERVKSPIICHQYTPASPTLLEQTPFIFTHGAGGTLTAPGVVNFCTGFSSTSQIPLLAFQGSMNLASRTKSFHACHAHFNKTSTGTAKEGLMFGGRSMGARAAVLAATEIASEDSSARARLVLVSYPLQGPKDVRDQILLDMPEEFEVLFIVGDRDAMCPLDLLKGVRRRMKAASRIVVVRGADHGMKVRPASGTKLVGEETGRLAARWLSEELEREGETLYIGDDEEVEME